MKLATVIFSFFRSIITKVVSQEFGLEGYELICAIPFTKNYDIWFNGAKIVIRFCGKEWENNRDKFMIEKHGMTFLELQKPENAHLRVARNYTYKGRVIGELAI